MSDGVELVTLQEITTLKLRDRQPDARTMVVERKAIRYGDGPWDETADPPRRVMGPLIEQLAEGVRVTDVEGDAEVIVTYPWHRVFSLGRIRRPIKQEEQ